MFLPSPRPASTPLPTAMPFLSAPAISAPRSSREPNTWKRSVLRASSPAATTSSKLLATTVAVGCPSAISLLRLGPLRHPMRMTALSSRMTCDIVRTCARSSFRLRQSPPRSMGTSKPLVPWMTKCLGVR